MAIVVNDSKKFLSFILDGNLFAFDVLKTQEVLYLTGITPLPGAPPYIAGMINLRGRVMTVMDLRLKLGIKASKPTPDSGIIILEARERKGSLVFGVLVDAIRGVTSFSEGIESAPRMGDKVNIEFINGIGKQEGRFVIVLDMDRIFSSDDVLFLRNDQESRESLT
jgi:purine-binding chemotaxis protein CheW